MPRETPTRGDAIADERLGELARSVRELDAAFSCGGAIDLEAPVELRLQTGRAVQVVADHGWPRRDIGKQLMKLCRPAPYGQGSVTRHDRRVRDGGQLSATGGAFRVDGFDLDRHGILGAIHRALCPGDARPPKAELYALNVYRSGGHFAAHKDTPRDRDVFGTLVVCLPVPFGGGRLLLRHATTRAYDWQIRNFGFERNDERYTVRWAAFYGDVDHEVERVTEGTRVTLTWLLRRPRESAFARPSAEASEADFEAALVAALEDPAFLPRGGTLGIPCVHLYAEVPGLVRPADALSRASARRLKGRDGMVARTALRTGVSVRYRPYLFETCADESWRLSRSPSDSEAAIFRGYRLGASDLEEVMPIEHHTGWNSADDVTWLLPPPWRSRRADDPSREAVPPTQLLGEVEYSATDYFGNEASGAAFYVAAALLLEVPSASRRATIRQDSRARRRSEAR